MTTHHDWRMSVRAAIRLVARIGLAVALLLALAPAATAQELPPQLKPVQIVVLVDESGSLSDEDVARERDAVRVIVQGEPSPESTVSVVGFGSANAPGQSAVEAACPPTKLSSVQSRQLLAECVGRLHRRTPAEGADTDHVTALRVAVDYLSAADAADQPKIVFLLTDGVLDVSDSPQYGENPGARNASAAAQIPGVLDELRRAGVQVWPLGFGTVDKAQLDGFATGGAQVSCGLRTPTPQARVITGSADLMSAIGAASSAARCTSVGDFVPGDLPTGGSVDLAVDIRAIATDGSILVYKRDPRVTVGYFDPRGTDVLATGGDGISRFELSGQSTEVEALRIVNPIPGRWTVRLSSAPGVPRQDVGVVVVFLGAVRAVLNVSPTTPQKGSPVEVVMQVRGARAAIIDPAELSGLAFVAGLTGDGFAPLPPVDLTDVDGDGQYQATIAVPGSATGRLDFTGSVSGIGVNGDERTYPTRIQDGAAGVQGVLSLDGPGDRAADVVIGASLTGAATVTNSSGRPRTLRLAVVDRSPGTVVAVNPPRLEVPASGDAVVLPFTLTFDPATAMGPNQARLQLVDDADGTVVAPLLFARNVVAVPTFFQRYWWVWVLIGVLLVSYLAVLVRGARSKRLAEDVRGTIVELRRNGQVIATRRAVPGKVYEFGLDRADLTSRGGGERYQVRRTRAGVTVTGPSGATSRPSRMATVSLADGLELVVHDRSTVRSPRRPPPDPSHLRRPVPDDDPYADPYGDRY